MMDEKNNSRRKFFFKAAVTTIGAMGGAGLVAQALKQEVVLILQV